MSTSDDLRVGSLTIPSAECERVVRDYLSQDSPNVWGYPHYDLFDTGSHPDRLTDGDLLAPNLLNAPVKLAAYAALQKRRDDIEAALAYVPKDVDLADATDAQIATLGPLFDCMQRPERKIPHVDATTFSKLVHRKRPQLVPLWDSHVKAVYQSDPKAPLDDALWELPWARYIVEVANVMRDDLAQTPDTWRRLSEGKVSMLRTLDIVAWSFAGTAEELPGEVEV